MSWDKDEDKLMRDYWSEYYEWNWIFGGIKECSVLVGTAKLGSK